MVEYPYWVWLSLALVPGTDTFAKLRSSFSSVKKIYRATEAELVAVLGERKDGTVKRLMNKSFDRVQRILDFVHTYDIGMLVYDDPKFPQCLRDIKNPPAMLYYKGRFPRFERSFYVSVVGSREHSDYTKRIAFELGYDLARGGTTLVSGMAKGLDSIAMAGALKAGGNVIGVLGSGIDIIYPKEHVYLSKVIESHGVIVTEYPPGTPPYGSNFPIRNRIISALGNAVLVVGGRDQSGSLITADIAKAQGRPLYALPGNVDDPYCAASDILLREGALPALCADDILVHFKPKFPYSIWLERLMPVSKYDVEEELDKLKVCYTRSERPAVVEPKVEIQPDAIFDQAYEERAIRQTIINSLSVDERAIYDRVPVGDGVYLDEVVDETYSPQFVFSTLTMLELKGLLKQVPGGRFAKIE